MRRILFILLVIILASSWSQASTRGDIVSWEEVFDYDLPTVYDEIQRRAAPLGVPIWLLNLLADVKYPLKGYKVTYWTLDVNPDDPDNQDGPLIQTSGLVIVPQITTCDLPMALYCHGTIFGDENAPSNPEVLREDFIAAVGFAGHGYYTVVPDYVGYADGARMHPYLDARTEAAASIDLMKAAGGIATEVLATEQALSGEVFITGHSQGGHAGMATSKAIAEDESLSEEFNVKYLGVSSGAYDLSGEQFNFVFGNPDYPGEELALMVLAGCQESACGTWDFCTTSRVLHARYVEDPYNTLILGQDINAKELIDGPWTKYFKSNYLRNIANSDLRNECLEKNNVYDWDNRVPTTMYYCSTDERVDPDNSLKTKAVQRSRIPWYQFWLRWQIKTVNSGCFDHLTCGLPSLYYARLNFDLNRSYCPYWKRSDAPAPQEIADIIVPPFLFFDAEIDFSQYRGHIVSVKLMDLNDALVEQWGQEELAGSRLTIPRGDLAPGIYGLIFQDESGKEIYKGIVVQDPELAVSDLYDPISPNPMQREATLDLSLLEDAVTMISIYGVDGTLSHRFQPEAQRKKIALHRGNLAAGHYVVEVRTARQSYFLPLEMLPVPQKGALIAPNPMYDKAWIDLTAIEGTVRAIQLFSPEGRLIRTYTGIRSGAEWFEIDRGDLPSGLYLLEINTDRGKKVAKMVVK